MHACARFCTGDYSTFRLAVKSAYLYARNACTMTDIRLETLLTESLI